MMLTARRLGGVVLGLYVAAVTLFIVGFRLRGVLDYDPAGRVVVTEGSPAARSGMLSGDRIVAVGGIDIARFEDIKPALRRIPDRLLTVAVEREGSRQELLVDRAGERMIGVRILVVRSDIGAAAVLARSLSEPASVWRRAYRDRYLSLSVAPDADGPVSCAEFLRPRERGDTVVSAGVLASYLLPLPVMLALALALRGLRRGA